MQALWYLHKKSTPFPSKIKSLPLLFPSLSRHRHLQLSFFFESSLLFTNFHKYSLKHSSRYNFVCSLTTSSVSSTRVVYANLIQWYASIIDCVDASDTISHWWDSGNATDASWQKKKKKNSMPDRSCCSVDSLFCNVHNEITIAGMARKRRRFGATL